MIAEIGGRSDFFRSNGAPIPFQELRTVAILAKKYNIQTILDEVVARLSRYFPSSSYDDFLRKVDTNPNIDLVPADAIAVASLARLLDAPHILPTVLYACCNLSTEELFDGVTYGDETVTLSGEDLFTCVEGRHRLLVENDRVMEVLMELLTPPELRPKKCSTPNHCQAAGGRVVAFFQERGLFSEYAVLADDAERLDICRADAKTKLCKHCDETLRKLLRERKMEAWAKLGDIFGAE